VSDVTATTTLCTVVTLTLLPHQVLA